MPFFCLKAASMPRFPLPLLSALLAAGLMAGCSSTPKTRPPAGAPIASTPKPATNSTAVATTRPCPCWKLEGRAAGTPLAQQAQLEKAYAQYKAGEKAQAIATLDRFMKLHPASPAYDYALYLKGLVNFNDNLGLFSWLSRQDLSERDQKAAKDSFESFRELTTRFPESRYAQDSRQRMTYIVNSLAQYEVHVARYYYERGAYVAAISRAQIALADYKEVPALEEALYILVKSYDALGMTQLRDDAQRVMASSYPQSELNRDGLKAKSEPWWKVW